TEIDAPLRGEIDRQLVAVVLPLRFADLHLETVLQHLLARDASHARLVGPEHDGVVHLLRPRGAQDAPLRYRRGTAGRAARALALGDGTRSGHTAEILAAVRLDDDVVADADVLLRDVVVATVSLEAHFDDRSHRFSRPDGRDLPPGPQRFVLLPALTAQRGRFQLLELMHTADQCRSQCSSGCIGV